MSASEQEDTHEAARRTLRLTKSPTEFIPTAQRETPTSATTIHSNMQRQFTPDPPSGQWGFQKFPANYSPRAGPTFNTNEPDPANESEGYIPGHPSQPNRDVNIKQLREIPTPPPRTGSPPNDPRDISDLTQQMLSFNTEIGLSPREPLSEDLKTALNRSDVIMAERERNLELYNTNTPQSLDEARKRGIGDAEYLLLQRRDLARRGVPDTTYPFLNNGQDVEMNLDKWPGDVRRAVLCKFN